MVEAKALLEVIRQDLQPVTEQLLRHPYVQALEEGKIGREKLRRYEAALERLSEEQREAVILRVEFGMSHAEVAQAMGKPNADAARMTVARAMVHLERAVGDA